MMVVDTSALMAVMLSESDREQFINSLAGPAQKLLSAVNGAGGGDCGRGAKGTAWRTGT
jgi:PIN domain nuclease of toxin-antitoxin system